VKNNNKLLKRREAVAMCYFKDRWNDTIYYLIFEVLGQNESYRKVLLESKELAYGIIQFGNKVWITVRGK
jgi:ribosomal protein S24E